MFSVKTILLSLLVSNLFVLVVLFLNSKNDIEESLLDEDSQFLDVFDDDSILDTTAAYDSDNSDVIDQVLQDLTDSDNNDVSSLSGGDMGKSSPKQGAPIDDPYGLQKEMQMTTEFLETAGKIINQVRKFRNALRSVSPFNLMEVYEPIEVKYFNAAPYGHPLYSYPNMGLINDASYCEFVDLYNLYHPENVYESMNFLTDYQPDGLVRSRVMDRIGVDTMPQVHKNMNRSTFYSKVFPLNYTTTLFFTKKVTFHYFHEIGKHFLCNSQLYNHIPGHGILTRIDLNVESVNKYAKRYRDQPNCFNRNMFFPDAFRLDDKEECRQFFRELGSEEYNAAKKKNTFYFIQKISYGAPRGSGVVLFDNQKEADIKKIFDNGRKCGEAFSQSIVMQRYISDPLLFDGHKFDFRVYLLIASTNPLIAFYHDGFLRLSLYYYKKDSEEKGVHLTNAHVSKDLFKKGPEGAKFGEMSETELRNYQMRSLVELQTYLLNIGRVSDKNWLDNYLRPQLQRAYIHLIRMSESHFLKNSGVFEMFGVDFLLDDNLNLWFIECNASPQLIGTNEEKTNMMTTMLANMFEVQYAYLRSRMKRIQMFMAKIHSLILQESDLDYRDLKKEFQELNKNRLEPEFELRQDMSSVKIMDKNNDEESAYMNLIGPECIDD